MPVEPQIVNNSWMQTIAQLLSGDTVDNPINGSWLQTIAYLIANQSGGTGSNFYTTGATLSGTTVIFDRNDLPAAYSVDLASIAGSGSGLNLDGGFPGSILMEPNYEFGLITSIPTDTIDGGGV
jgi:hypothetical protein